MRAVNLIPADQRGGGTVGTRSGGAAFLVLGLLAGIAVLALLYGMAHHSIESRRAEAVSLTARAAEVQAQAARLAPYTTFMAMREQRLQAVAQLVGSRFDWSNAMGELSRVLPSNVALTTVQGTIGTAESTGRAAAPSTPSAAATVASSTPPGATPTVTLGGCAASQSVVAQMLVRLRLIGGVSDVVLQSSTKSGGSSGGGGGSCPGGDPVFNVQVTFNPLPSVTPTTSAPATSSAPSSGSAASSGSAGSSYTPSGGAAR
jgi:Tfp pilus assembly protein PilN